jgi:hypothetical protein
MDMKVFICNDFEGHYPVGAAAVIIARSEEIAKTMLNMELQQRGLGIKDATLKEVELTNTKAIILCDGDY